MQDKGDMSLAGRATFLVERSRGLVHRSRALREALNGIGDARQVKSFVDRKGAVEALGLVLRM